MNRWSPVLLAALATAASSATGAEQRLGEHTFTLPDGFTVDQVAGNDLVPRPVSASFDPQGRLYVTDSSGSNLPPSEQLKNPGGRILRLEDSDGDGRFDRSVVYADRVMFPQGCLWHDGSVYVAGPPSIWKFTDTDGDGIADKREEWYRGQVLTGCANDVHGPYLGPEGMIYWTKGAFARLDLKDGKGRPLHDRCAHLFRARPDGSGLESVMAGGMDNPVDVAFSVTGEPFVIGTFFDLSQPGRRDGLIHAVYGGVFGKANDVVEERVVTRTGDLLPVMTHFGPAAACALTRYDGNAFGAEYRNNLFATLFNLHKVTRHVLEEAGASFRTADSDFLVSDQIDFHPTDVLPDADGSLLVVDTGGWYKLCCPSSQLAKADVLGGIYRVRRTAPAADVTKRRNQPADYAKLVQPPPLDDHAELVQIKRLSLAGDPGTAGKLRDVLTGQLESLPLSPRSAQLARVAAEGLGRMADKTSIPLLLRALEKTGVQDRFLEHAFLYALVEIGDASALRPFVGSDNPSVRRAALLALDQLPGEGLAAADVAPWLAAESEPLRTTARWIASRHPEWGDSLAEHFRERLTSRTLPATDRARWEQLLDLLAHTPTGQGLLAEASVRTRFQPETRVAALNAMANAGLKEPPASWSQSIITALGERSSHSTEASRMSAALRAARSVPISGKSRAELDSVLHAVARDSARPPSLRVDALAALPPESNVDETEWKLLRSALDPTGPPRDRLAAASTIGKVKATPQQQEDLLGLLTTLGPLELPRLLPAFAQGDEATAGKLLASLRQSKALRSVRPDDLRPILARYPESIRKSGEDILTSMASDASQERERLHAVLAEIGKLQGEVRRGQAIFNSPKAACSSCHRLGYLGGNVGPDLTAIGTVRTETDLIEAVLFPSASFVRSYEPWIATCKDGEEYSGVLRGETPEEIVLATGPGADVRVPRSTLVELRPGAVSTMPAGLDEQLSRQDLADLLAFLKNTKWGVN